MGDFEFKYLPDGSVSVTGYRGKGGAVVVPAAFEGSPVTAIGDGAFAGYYGITSVVLPDGITDIGNDAFRSCTGLTSINFPDGLAFIGDFAFKNCVSLASVALPSISIAIGCHAFRGCKISSWTWANGGLRDE